MDVLNVSVTLAAERPNEIEDLTGLQTIAMQLQQPQDDGARWTLGRRRFCLREGNMMDIQDGQRVRVKESSLLGAGISTRAGRLTAPEARAIHEIGENRSM